MTTAALPLPASAAPTERSAFELLVRDPAEAVRRALSGDGSNEIVRAALASILFGGALYGGVVGSYRGETQIAFAAVKMPLVLIATLAVTSPALWALGVSAGRTWTMRAAAALTLVAAGRAALVLTALSPLLWLAIDLGSGYHFSSFLAAVAFGLGGVAALATLVRGLGGARGIFAALLAAAVFAAALAQTGWVLRPWLGRPSQPVVFLRTEAGVGPITSVVESASLGMRDPTGSWIEGSSL